MQQRYVYPIDLTEMNKKLELICNKSGKSKAESIRDAINFYYNNLMGLKVIELRDIPKKQAEKEILNYLKKNEKAFTSEIADNLRIDVVLVNEILTELAEKGMIE